VGQKQIGEKEMTKKELHIIAKSMQAHAAAKLFQGCLTDCWLDDKVSDYAGNWAVPVRVDDLMALCAAILEEKT
jgi:hypothetical protein